MSLVISHNFAASYAARHLEKNDDNLRNSLNKLSSGQRICARQMMLVEWLFSLR